MISFFLSLLLIPSHTQPSTSEDIKNPDTARLVSQHIPRICKECCFDIMFVLDRSESVKAGASIDNWLRMKNVVSDLGLTELNDKRVRFGAMQMGSSEEETNKEVLQSGTGKTGVRFNIRSGPLNDKQLKGWGVDLDTFGPTNPDYHLAAKIALRELTSDALEKPWIANKVCTPTNSRRLVIWMVDSPIVGNSPCEKQTDESQSVIHQMLDASTYNFVVGVGAGDQFESLKCMFPGVEDFENVITATPKWQDLQDKMNELLDIDPCNACQNLDIVLLMDESGSLCDPETPATADPKNPCTGRKEWDNQINFVKLLVQALAPTWGNHRVGVYTFGSEVRATNIRTKCTGAPSKNKYRGTNRDSFACAPEDVWTAEQVQKELDSMKETFVEGQTATAWAVSEAMHDLHFLPERVDGKSSRKVMILMTDGGPNPPYYAVDSPSFPGKRYKANQLKPRRCPHSKPNNTPPLTAESKDGYCLDAYYQKWFVNAKGTQQNQAVCTDKGDKTPPARRKKLVDDAKSPQGKKWEEYADDKGYQAVIKDMNIVPIIIKVGDAVRIEEHKKDIDCLYDFNGSSGGILNDVNFMEITDNKAYVRAIINAMCKDVPLGTSTEQVTQASTQNIFAQWNQYVEWKQAQQQAQITAGVPVTNLHLGASLMFGMVVGGIMVVAAKRTSSSSKYDYEQLLNTESV